MREVLRLSAFLSFIYLYFSSISASFANINVFQRVSNNLFPERHFFYSRKECSCSVSLSKGCTLYKKYTWCEMLHLLIKEMRIEKEGKRVIL